MKDDAQKISHNKRNNDVYEPGLVSVIIPTYNRADCIAGSIDSVLAQTYQNYEIIVVDDGSTDNTKQVLQPYVDNRHIQYLYQKNAGCAAARNTGIRASCGEWIAFLDSDDRWLPEKLECQVQYLHETRLEVCFTNTYFDSGDESENAITNPETRSATDRWIVTEPLDIVTTPNPFHTTLPSMLIKRGLLDKTGCFDEWVLWGSDSRFILKVCTERPIAYINKKLVIADRTAGRDRLTINRDMNSETGKAHLLMKVLTYAEVYFRCRKQNKKVARKVRRIFGNYVSSLAISCCIENNTSDARRFARDGIHFGGDLRAYARCFAVLLFPRLVKHLRKKRRTASIT